MSLKIYAHNIYIIIVTYNGMPWIKTCLESCGDFSIIVVDNASTDGTVSYIKEKFPKILLFEQERNLGFGQANNIGIKQALINNATHVFLLNQDAYLVDNTISKLYDFQIKNPQFGVLSPIHLTIDKQRLDTNFFEYMMAEKTNRFFSDYILNKEKKQVYEVPFVNAAAWLISKACLETVGGFDPLFFHYGEDNNYCQRVLFHNFKVGVIPTAYAIHDREDRIVKKNKRFSKEYYEGKEKYYKSKFANILIDNHIENEIKKLDKIVFNLAIRLKIKRFKLFKKELTLLKSLKDKINSSRLLNIKKGSHYL